MVANVSVVAMDDKKQLYIRIKSMCQPIEMQYGLFLKLVSPFWKQRGYQVAGRWLTCILESMSKTLLPRCSLLELRLSIVSVQLADMERMYKVHSVIHSKSCNILQHNIVKKKLLYY